MLMEDIESLLLPFLKSGMVFLLLGTAVPDPPAFRSGIRGVLKSWSGIIGRRGMPWLFGMKFTTGLAPFILFFIGRNLETLKYLFIYTYFLE